MLTLGVQSAGNTGNLMLVSKIFLALCGLLYAGLAIWCTVSPEVTSEKVGFEIKPGSGQSEFVTVYGGLEMGLAIIFLLPLFRSDLLFSSLLACVVIHACLVIFRSFSFFLFTDISSMTYKLAAGEWVILIIGVICLMVFKDLLAVSSA